MNLLHDHRARREPESLTAEGLRGMIRRVIAKRAEQYPGTAEYYAGERKQLEAMLASSGALPMLSTEQVAAWAARHGIEGTPVALRTMIDDARNLHLK